LKIFQFKAVFFAQDAPAERHRTSFQMNALELESKLPSHHLLHR